MEQQQQQQTQSAHNAGYDQPSDVQPVNSPYPAPAGLVYPPVAGQWVIVNSPPPEVIVDYSDFRQYRSKVCGIFMITTGCLSIVWQAVVTGDTSFDINGSGIWCGITSIVAGIIGIVAGRKKSKCLIIAFLVSCIIVAAMYFHQLIVEIVVLSVTANDYYSKENDKNLLIAMSFLLLVTGFVGCIAAIVASTSFIWKCWCCTCCACCCSCCLGDQQAVQHVPHQFICVDEAGNQMMFQAAVGPGATAVGGGATYLQHQTVPPQSPPRPPPPPPPGNVTESHLPPEPESSFEDPFPFLGYTYDWKS